MENELLLLNEIRKNFEPIGKKIFEVCGGTLYPADVLFLASCNRSIQVLDGFLLLMKNSSYSCSMALLRIQLDTILRLYGITQTKDVHESANEIIKGTRLSDIKDCTGKKLQDGHLVNLISVQNPWVRHVYKLCSGYIHLSDMSFYHLIGLSETVPNSTERVFYIGSNEEHVEEQYKLELIEAFKVITVAVQSLTNDWLENRHHSGSFEELAKKYAHPI